MKEIYLDNAATTIMSEKALDAMEECMRECWANPSSLHLSGQRAAAKVEEARDIIAEVIGAFPDEIIFTSGATESNNLAIRGYVSSYGAGLVTQETEHPSVINTAKYLIGQGTDVRVIPVDENGMPAEDFGTVIESFRGSPVLVSVMHTNNETGTLLPVKDIADTVHALGGAFHCDAVQALGKVPLDVKRLGTDMLSASAHKFHGPKGTGFLYVKSGISLKGITMGGEQERSLRPGTVNTPAIWAMAAALREAADEMERASGRMKRLKEMLKTSLSESIPGIHVNGAGGETNCCTLNVSFPGVGADMLLFALDREGLRVSAGSACSAGSLEISHVIRAMGAEKYGAPIRYSLSRYTTEEEILCAARITAEVYNRLLQQA